MSLIWSVLLVWFTWFVLAPALLVAGIAGVAIASYVVWSAVRRFFTR